jgi:thioesterase domain-containing protein/acyl carrier protein
MKSSIASMTPSSMPSPGELESQLIRVWESSLGKHGIGVQDSFWDLGGQSFIALRMMRRIEKLFGKSLPITALFQAPTIEKLAQLLRQSGWTSTWTSLVCLQAAGSAPYFFCVHGIGGLVVGLRDLARHLGMDQPVYGFQAQGTDGTHPILASVEEMAAHYLEEMRTIQPQGPYYLGGLSFGGWVAYEMARQLRAQGEQVRLLALIDTYATKQSKSALVLRLFRLPPRVSLGLGLRRAVRYFKEARISIQFLFLPRPLKEVRKTLHRASDAYLPPPYPGKVTLFRAGEKSIRDFGDSHAEWSRLVAGELEIQEIPANHNNILREPQVIALARQLKACLHKSQQEARDRQKGADHIRNPSDEAIRTFLC